MNGTLSVVDLFRWLWQRKRVILITQVIAIGTSVVLTSPRFIHPEYKSSTIVYPTRSTDSKDASELAIGVLLEYLNSVDVKNAVIKKFNLIRHYKIDTLKRDWYKSLLKEYDANVTVDPTLYLAAEINVYDISPDTACMMVNDIIKEVSDKMLSVQKEKAKEYLVIFKKQMDDEIKNIDSLLAIETKLSTQYGLMDYGTQTKELVRAYYQMTASSKGGKALDEISTQIKNLEEKGPEYKVVNEHLNNSLTAYNAILLNYQNAIKDADRQQTFVDVVSKPFRAEEKSYPNRSFITSLVSLSVLFFSIVLLLFIEKIRQ